MKGVDQSTNEASRPFVLNFVPTIDADQLERAIIDASLIASSYDPQSQTSSHPIYAGSSLTYSDTFSGLWGNSDDNRQSDT